MMEKVMNSQTVVSQPRTEALAPRAAEAGSAGVPKKGGKNPATAEGGFDAQMMAAALMVQPQPQPQQAGIELSAMAQAMDGSEKTEAALTPELALNKKAASTNTGSAIAGLKQPWSPKDIPTDMALASREGKGTELKASLPTVSVPPRQPMTETLFPGEGASGSVGARGETDTALNAKLEMLAYGAPMMELGSGAPLPKVEDVQAALQRMLQAQPQAPQMASLQASNAMISQSPTAPDAALEAQLASLGGVVQGLMPQETSGKGLAAGAKGRLPNGAAQAGLSGEEFMSALGAAKGGVIGSRLQKDSQFQGEQGEGKGTGLGGKPSLRMVPGSLKGGKAEFDSELTAQSLGNLANAPGTQGAVNGSALAGTGTAEVAGHVTKGANAEDRLSSESLTGISTGLRNISNQGTGGEMRIRLKPENLGELHVRVVTDGRNVGLQIQASDEKARKVIEESISHLRESMAGQNLSLGTVDLTVAQSQSAGFGDNRGNSGQDSSLTQNQTSQFNDMLGGQGGANQSNQREGRGGAWTGDNNPGSVRTARAGAFGAPGSASLFGGSARTASAASGRLDVTA